MDIVGYSKVPTDRQRELSNELNTIVRDTDQFKSAEAAGKLVRLPTGDGMALAFFTNPEAPLKCAIEITRSVRHNPGIPLRIGLHSGPVSGLSDVNDRSNVAGAGINVAQRLMDCGDTNHILLSRRIADDLAQNSRWENDLHDLGQIEVKHGVRLDVVNFYDDEVGNANLPEKFKEAARAGRLELTRRRKRMVIGAALLLAMASGVFFWWFAHQTSFPTAALPVTEKSIAVLPLENLTEEKENAYFADGIQDELLSNLAKIRDLKVISRTSVMQYKAGITRNLKEIAHQLGVSNVVEGSVRRSGNHVRVSVQLIDALADRHIWSQNYDRTLADSLALQGELATEIASGVGATLSPQEKTRVEATPTHNTAAYDAYLRGRALAAGLTVDHSNLESAARSFEEAVRLDPNFALAWAYLSAVESSFYWSGNDHSAARLAAAKNALDHAMALDSNLPETHLALGYYHYYGLRDFSGALAEFQLAEKSLPNDVEALTAIGLIQRRFAHWDEANAVLRRVVELDPRNIQSAGILATTYIATRRFPDALAVADHILAVEPTNKQGIGLKAFSLWALGNLEAVDVLLANPGVSSHLRAHQALLKHKDAEAVDLFSKALKDAAPNDKNDLLLGLALARNRAGDVAGSKAAYQEAAQGFKQALSELDKDAPRSAQVHSSLGWAYAGLGDATLAVSEGQKGMALDPTSEDPFEGPDREEGMAQIYSLLGNADEAIPILKRWINLPSGTAIAPPLLRIDPIWEPIRNDPRFQELVAEKKP